MSPFFEGGEIYIQFFAANSYLGNTNYTHPIQTEVVLLNEPYTRIEQEKTVKFLSTI